MKNREINTKHAPEQETLTLEAKAKTSVFGETLEAGQTITVTRSQARQILRINSSVRVRVD